MKIVRCVYCEWVGRQPSPAEFQSDEAFHASYAAFENDANNHACAKRIRDMPAAVDDAELEALEAELFG